jgi:hypothetical protein
MATAAVVASRNFFTLLSPFCWAHSLKGGKNRAAKLGHHTSRTSPRSPSITLGRAVHGVSLSSFSILVYDFLDCLFSSETGVNRVSVRGRVSGCLRCSRSQRLHGLASGAAEVCMIRPTTRRPDAPRFFYVLRPAGFIGHCNVRLSLNVAGEFRTSKKNTACP